jgi:hypothetical protein
MLGVRLKNDMLVCIIRDTVPYTLNALVGGCWSSVLADYFSWSAVLETMLAGLPIGRPITKTRSVYAF